MKPRRSWPGCCRSSLSVFSRAITACLAQAVLFWAPQVAAQVGVPAAVAAPDAAAAVVRSGDGRFGLQAQGETLALFDAGGALLHRYPARDLAGNSSAVRTVLDHPARRSFIVVFATLAELWEMPYAPDAEPVFEGMVHDYRMGEAIRSPDPVPIRRTRLTAPIVELVGDPNRARITVREADGVLRVIHLDVRREIETIAPVQ
jgi:hypothetical protein